MPVPIRPDIRTALSIEGKGNRVDRLFGIETEYGIIREDLQESDPMMESMELVRSYLPGPFRPSWDYGGEDPRQDARGFRVERLAQDEEEKSFEQIDRRRRFSFHEMKSDLSLTNGARFYNDHTHPEYSTPECSSLMDLVVHDKAGERIVQECADRRNAVLGGAAVQIYKNNTDLHGHSYGCHDNYLVPRSMPFERIVTGLMPFLVTRQVFAGAGKVGIEERGTYRAGHYQISQRADFIEVELSVDTMDRRPIINTRDEPHADPSRYRRLHQILGDANLCETATALKIGTTWLVLRLIGEDRVPKGCGLEEPVSAVREVSRDPSCRRPIRRLGGGKISPVDHQEIYLRAAQDAFGGDADSETRWILDTWERVLADLRTDPMRLADRLDWVAKRWLLEAFMDAERCGIDDPRLKGLDLEYHNLHPERGLFCGLEMEGRIRRITTDEQIKAALVTPPAGTRAGIRGLCIERFGSDIHRIQWEKVVFQVGDSRRELDLGNLFDPSQIDSLQDRIRRASNIQEVFA